MSASSKGKAFEKKIEAFLTDRGFKVQRTWPKYGFFKDPGGKLRVITSRQDFFGCADLIAVHPQRQRTYFIQCTLTDAAVRRTKMETVPWNLKAQHVLVIKRMEINKQELKIYYMTTEPFTETKFGEWWHVMFNFKKPDPEVLRSIGI